MKPSYRIYQRYEYDRFYFFVDYAKPYLFYPSWVCVTSCTTLAEAEAAIDEHALDKLIPPSEKVKSFYDKYGKKICV